MTVFLRVFIDHEVIYKLTLLGRDRRGTGAGAGKVCLQALSALPDPCVQKLVGLRTLPVGP